MAEMFKALLMGLGCLMTLWLGSCTLFGVGTVVAVNTAAQIAQQEATKAAKETPEYKAPSKWDRNSSSSYSSDYSSSYDKGYYSGSGATHVPNKIDGKPMTNPDSRYDD